MGIVILTLPKTRSAANAKHVSLQSEIYISSFPTYRKIISLTSSCGAGTYPFLSIAKFKSIKFGVSRPRSRQKYERHSIKMTRRQSAQRTSSRIGKRTRYPRLGAEQEAMSLEHSVTVNRHDNRHLLSQREREIEKRVRCV